MYTECHRIADQIRRAFAGDPWHGDSLKKLLAEVSTEQANRRPLASGHTIWELVLHIDVWARIACEAMSGIAMPKLYGTEKDWPAPADTSAKAWTEATSQLLRTGELLAQAAEGFTDARLKDVVPGREYDFYYLLHGVVQHSLYHGGQIALLKRAM
jgi:uncharacterized damage-inducible protein DinB